jgi:BirA family biotin operon repressor/biotin-[acetyl-CoA-carboxylase] ligase
LSSSNPIGHPFIELLSVDSTNNYAMGLVHAGMAQHGTAVFTRDQTKGRGQRSRQWISEPGSNIAITLILEPKGLSSSQMFLLSQCLAVGVRRFFNRYTTGDTFVKWPNDLYWRDRKAGGILIENVLQGSDWKYALAGVGININQTKFDRLAARPVSLRQITGKKWEPGELALELCTEIDLQFGRLYGEREALVEEYQQSLYKRGEVVRLKKDSRVFDARIKHVTPDGRLVVEHQVEEYFEVGEVEWVVG